MEKCKSKEGKIFFNYPKSSQKGNSNEGMRSSWKRTKIFRPPKISHDEALSQIACHKDALEDERIKKLSFRDVVQPFPMILPSKKKTHPLAIYLNIRVLLQDIGAVFCTNIFCCDELCQPSIHLSKKPRNLHRTTLSQVSKENDRNTQNVVGAMSCLSWEIAASMRKGCFFIPEATHENKILAHKNVYCRNKHGRIASLNFFFFFFEIMPLLNLLFKVSKIMMKLGAWNLSNDKYVMKPLMEFHCITQINFRLEKWFKNIFY